MKYIKEKIGVELPKDEAASIALHLVNAETQNGNLDKTIQKQKYLKILQKLFQQCLMSTLMKMVIFIQGLLCI